MSQEYARTKCPCGADIEAPIRKPTHFTPTVSKLSCLECDSRFLLHVEIAKSKPPFVRKFVSRFEVIRLSKEANDRAKNPVRQVVSKVIEKASKKDVPKF